MASGSPSMQITKRRKENTSPAAVAIGAKFPRRAATGLLAKPRRLLRLKNNKSSKHQSKSMKTEYVDSLGLKSGFRVTGYSTVDEITKAAGKDDVIVDVINKYLRQKGALVDARDVFIEKLEKETGFKPVTRVDKRTRDGKEESVTVWDETEGEYLGRFRSAILKAEFRHPKYPAEKDALENALQALADTCGDEGTTPPAFVLDIRVPERVRKAKELPKWAQQAVESIYSDVDKTGAKKKTTLAARIKQWATTFTNESIPFEPFDLPVTKPGDENDTNNRRRLGLAIVEREARKPKPDYA